MTGPDRAGAYIWMRARFADYTHLVREALLTARTQCGIPVSGPVPLRETGHLGRICPGCQAAITNRS